MPRNFISSADARILQVYFICADARILCTTGQPPTLTSSPAKAFGLRDVSSVVSTRVPARTLANPIARSVLEYPFVLRAARAGGAAHRVGIGAAARAAQARIARAAPYRPEVRRPGWDEGAVASWGLRYSSHVARSELGRTERWCSWYDRAIQAAR